MPDRIHLLPVHSRAEGRRVVLAAPHADGLRAVLDRLPDFAALLDGPLDAPADDTLRRAETVGRPVGDAAFVEALEVLTGRTLAARRPGRGLAE